jgi:SAM-dependent methyltransferase
VTCRICSGATEEIFRSERCPRASHKFARAPVPASYNAIVVLRCGSCGTVQLDRPYEEEYADDYQRNTSFSPSALAFMRENAEWLRATFPGGMRPRALEIGCGDGSFLDMLRDHFDVEGIEPSRAAAELARQKGLRVRNGYFDPAGATGSYDAVVLRFVIEHIWDPHAFLAGVRRVLRPGGRLHVELPNYDLQRKDVRFFEFFREHVYYFDPRALLSLLYRHGFSLLRSRTFMNDEYLMAIFERDPDTASFMDSQVDISAAFARMLAEPGARTIACWGASGGGVSLLAYSGVDAGRICYLVDSDPNKHGLYVYGTGLEIRSPAVLREDATVDAVIILSPAYEAEIARLLRDDYGFRGRLGSIKGVPHWIA